MAKSRFQNPFLPNSSAMTNHMKLQSGTPCGTVEVQVPKVIDKTAKKRGVKRLIKRRTIDGKFK